MTISIKKKKTSSPAGTYFPDVFVAQIKGIETEETTTSGSNEFGALKNLMISYPQLFGTSKIEFETVG